MNKGLQDLCEKAAAIYHKHGCSIRSETSSDFQPNFKPDRSPHDHPDSQPDPPKDSPINYPRDFPAGLWRDLGRENLMGILVPKRYGGLGLGLTALGRVTEQLVISGASMGFGLSFLIHHLVCQHFITTHAGKGHREVFLSSMASGERTAAIAVSEPGVGAHPKYLKTRVERIDGDLIIDGEKSFVTNAPLADFFIVIAVTGTREQRNLFSALIVPRKTCGLTVGDPMDIGRLHPCPHASLTLERCQVEKTFVTGKPDLAFETMVVPFRRLEELMVPAIVSGGLVNRFKTLGNLLPKNLQKGESQTLEAMAGRLSQMVRSNIKECMNVKRYDFPPAKTRKFARVAEQSRQYIRDLMQTAKITPDREQEQFDKDLTTLLGLFH